MRGQEGGGRALRCLVAAAGLVAALSAAGTVFLLGQWRELSAAVRQLQEDAARRPPSEPPPPSLSGPAQALRDSSGALRQPLAQQPPTAPSGSGGDDLTAPAGRSKRSQRGRGCAKLRLENDDAFLLMSYSVVPVRVMLELCNGTKGVLLALTECLVSMDLMAFLAFPGKMESPEDEGNQDQKVTPERKEKKEIPVKLAYLGKMGHLEKKGQEGPKGTKERQATM
ncbi:UNVERIFIED_CONTAM: hypothetical protein K2H54_016072 [Gekko kuhli]